MTRVTELFEDSGTIANALESYELRREQVQMAEAVERCIESGGVLLAEAGTGTGKTLAYLAPAIFSGLRVVVSTGTKNLQEQIFFKDIEFLERALEVDARAAYLKGQDNYLCLRSYQEFVGSPAVLAHPPERAAELERWHRTTRTGDRMEIEGLADDDPIWREVCSTRETRIGQKCRFFDQCYVTRARQAAQRAGIVVVNHHLYFADLATRMRGGAILPPHDVVIFDEAHLIEDVATEFFSIKASSGRVDRMLRDVLAAVRGARLAEDPGESRRASQVASARSLAVSLFAAFRGATGRAQLDPASIDDQTVESYHRLDASLEAIEQSLRVLEGRDPGIDHCADRIAGISFVSSHSHSNKARVK